MSMCVFWAVSNGPMLVFLSFQQCESQTLAALLSHRVHTVFPPPAGSCFTQSLLACFVHNASVQPHVPSLHGLDDIALMRV